VEHAEIMSQGGALKSINDHHAVTATCEASCIQRRNAIGVLDLRRCKTASRCTWRLTSQLHPNSSRSRIPVLWMCQLYWEGGRSRRSMDDGSCLCTQNEHTGCKGNAGKSTDE